MLQALLLQRTAFIELLVMNGFVMKNFLTVEKLAKLYNEAVTQFQAWNYAKNFFVLFLQTKKFKELNIQLKQICGINSSVILLRHIHKFLQVIVKDHSHPIYKYHTYKVRPTCIHPNLHLLTYTNPASDITNSHWSENTFLSEKSLGNFLCFWYLKMSEKKYAT